MALVGLEFSQPLSTKAQVFNPAQIETGRQAHTRRPSQSLVPKSSLTTLLESKRPYYPLLPGPHPPPDSRTHRLHI